MDCIVHGVTKSWTRLSDFQFTSLHIPVKLGKKQAALLHDKFFSLMGHHQFNGHEFEQTLGDDEGQGSLACCSPWGRKELDTTEQLNSI